MDKDEKVMLFFSLTDSSDPDEALQILEQNNWDLDASVNHYLLIHDSEVSPSKSKSTPPPIERESSSADNDMEEFETFDEENIRAPIPSSIQTLVEGGMYDDPYLASYPANRRKPGPSTTNVFEAFRDFSAEGKFGGAGNSIPKQTAKQQQLAKLFEPPYDVLSFGTFTQVKKLAADSKLMLLVNIQDISNFDCQVLNRDTWSDKGLKGYIKEHFIFWQIAHNNPEGIVYCNLYPVGKYPHISIIEPNTGMKKATHEGIFDSNDAYKFLQQFIIGQSRGEPKKQKKYTSEEEELELAIQRSLGQDIESPPSRKNMNFDIKEGEDEEEEEENSADEKEQEQEDDLIEEEDLEKFENPPPVVVPPMNQPDTIGNEGDCTIQIRLPGGDILQGKFNSTDKIQKLYYFVSVKKGINNFALCTTFPKKELAGDLMNKTLAEQELTPRAVLILQEKN